MESTQSHNDSLSGIDSIFIGSRDAPIHDVPMRVISRPIPSVLDSSKVEEFACKLQAGS